MLIPKRDRAWLLENGKNLEPKAGERWYCITTHPEREIDVARRLHELGARIFMPLLIEDEAATRVRPLWSRYIYARFSDQLWPYVKSYNGVVKIIKRRDEAAIIAELESVGLLNRATEEFRVGQRVIVQDGTFAGQIGVIQAQAAGLCDVAIETRSRATKVSATLPARALASYGPEPRHTQLVVVDERPYIPRQPESQVRAREANRKALLETVRTFNAELIQHLAAHPNLIYNLAPRAFEQLIADVLTSMGYEVELTPETRDHGRDILAVFTLPHGKVLTIVECKRNAPDRPVGIDVVQRFLWVINEQDRANGGLIATTSYFSPEARNLQKQFAWRLKLKDFAGVSNWLDRYGTWEQREDTRLWLPATAV